jgi:hypothetical protein
MKTKDEMLKVTKMLYSYGADLRQIYQLFLFIRDDVGENKSQAIIDFIKSTGATNSFSTPYEQMQN